MRPKRKKRRRKKGKGEVVEKIVGTSEAQLSWLQRQRPVGKERRSSKDGEGKPKDEDKVFRGGEHWGDELCRVPSINKGKSRKKEPRSDAGKRKIGKLEEDKGVREYRERRKPSRETKSRKKGGSVRQIPRGVSTKRGIYRACKWVRDGVLQGKKAQGQGSVKSLRVERVEKYSEVKQVQHNRSPKRGKGKGLKSVLVPSLSKGMGKKVTEQE
jgi:hypothetical protein